MSPSSMELTPQSAHSLKRRPATGARFFFGLLRAADLPALIENLGETRRGGAPLCTPGLAGPGSLASLMFIGDPHHLVQANGERRTATASGKGIASSALAFRLSGVGL